MCGIVGILDLTGRLGVQELERRCVAMRDRLVHRGPDDCGLWASDDGRCVLGQRRLSIIDTSVAGTQPMVSELGALTFNGEIYNFQDLRRRQEELGQVFASHTDTEVLLHGLDRQGSAFLDQADGMYAFAHYNRRNRVLTLARDRFGEKPLYLYRSETMFAFASELSALSGLAGFDPAISRDRIAAFLCFQYVPAPHTIYQAVTKLPPGQMVAVDERGDTRVIRAYEFTTSAEAGASRSLDDAADELEEILVRSIRNRLISDVPLGAFLSGGVDSSTVVALAAKRLNCSLNTFSMGFQDAPDSEHDMAAAIAAHLDVPCTLEIMAPGTLPDLVGLIGRVLDEPNGDSSCLPTYFLSAMTRKHVTVALSGDGGDEMFGGYGRYFATLADQARHLGGDPAMREWRPGPAYISSRLLFFTERDLAPLFGALPESLAQLLAQYRDRLDGDPRPLINRMREHDARTYLPGAVLAKVDRMSMQHSLEVRSPFLGNEVAAFAQSLPSEHCWDGKSGKTVLKRVAKRYLPAEWIDRSKLGFGLPMRSWGEEVALSVVRDLLHPGQNRLSEWLGQDAIERFLAIQAQRPMMYHLWAVAVLEHWLRTHPARPV